MPDNRRPSRGAASSPVLAARPLQPVPPIQDSSIRSMRLKVLYTFDDESKTTCLARWPQPIDIRTANLDEQTQIGVIELKTCIQAIVAASPELVAKLGQDYTVYAYDYSEYETPLVGQGMLSWVLASSSATPAAPAHQSRTMVTGRVSTNVLGLFSNGAQETLEVKLRLVPVPTSLQSEYLESMKRYRDLSQIVPPSFDPQIWTAFVKANPGFMQQATQSRSESPATGMISSTTVGMEQVRRLLGGDSATTQAESRRPLSRSYSYAEGELPHQLPRMPSPALSVQSSASAPKRRGRKPGPKGPRGGKAASRKVDAASASTDTGYASHDERTDDGPAKKRAKVVQTEWSGKQDFAKQPESLRVAASTAASVRIHQPTAIRPAVGRAHALEGPPREPTPIADPSQAARRVQPATKSSLRYESSASEKKIFAMPYQPPEGSQKGPTSAVTSPENSRVDSSPPEMGSSPPVFRDSTAASSPNVPLTRDNFHDSGFMSESLDDLFEDHEFQPLDEEHLDLLNQHDGHINFDLDTSQKLKDAHSVETADVVASAPQSDVEQTETPQLPLHPHNPRSLNRTISAGSFPRLQFPASDPVQPPSLTRSQTWAGHQDPHPASDAASMPPPPAEAIERPGSRNRKGNETGQGSGLRRKQAIQSKLATSIAAGEMPPFCENCGAIETPTWRKAWVKIHSGTPEHVRISDEEGAIIAWQTLQTDNTGTICLYRIIKRSLLKIDEGFTEILLCNPCGLWLHTRKCMRPRETWDKSSKGPDEKRRRGSAAKRPRTGSMSNLATARGSASTLYSEPSSPTTHSGGQAEAIEADPELPLPKRPRASSEERTPQKAKHMPMDDASAAAALERAIRASPHKFVGSQKSPIELGDLTPKPTRRVLFPSPSNSKEGQSKPKSLVDSANIPIKLRNNSEQTRTSPSSHTRAQVARQLSVERNTVFDDFLVTEQEFSARSKATTPSKAKPGQQNLLTTPKSSPRRDVLPISGDFFSSAAKALFRHKSFSPSKRTPNRSNTGSFGPLEELSPFTANMNRLLSEPIQRQDKDTTMEDARDGPSSPDGSAHTFDFPSLPSLHNTPGGRPGTRTLEFDFSAFDSQDLISTDIPIPSSPPVWFGMYGNGDIEEEDRVARELWGPDAGASSSLPNGVMDSSPVRVMVGVRTGSSSGKTDDPGDGSGDNGGGNRRLEADLSAVIQN